MAGHEMAAELQATTKSDSITQSLMAGSKRTASVIWKVRLIKEDFHRSIWDVEDV